MAHHRCVLFINVVVKLSRLTFRFPWFLCYIFTWASSRELDVCKRDWKHVERIRCERMAWLYFPVRC